MVRFFEGEEGATKIILSANIFLISVKVLVVLLTGSLGVIASLADSAFDFLGGLLAYFGVRKAREPPDHDHHYGHHKYGALSGLGQLLLIAIVAFLILFEAGNRFFHPIALSITSFDLAVMGVAILVDVFMARYLWSKASKYRSTALEASAANYTSDIMQNSIVLIGLAGASVGFNLADPLAAIIISLLMLRIVFKVGRRPMLELTDASPSKELIANVERIIRSTKSVKGYHKLRARVVGGRVYIDVHVQFDPKLSLKRAHALSGKLKHTILKKIPEVKEVLIHQEPYAASD